MVSRPIRNRRGAVLVKMALSIVLFFAFATVAIDLGLLYATQANLQAAADAAALAGAQVLAQGEDVARAEAQEFAAKNLVNGEPLALVPGDVEVGSWDTSTRTFAPLDSDSPAPDAVRVTPRLSESRGSGVGLLFARAFGYGSAEIAAEAIAHYRSRDIMVVLDFSASMNDDSELRHIDSLGQSFIESSLYLIWTELGAPTFGNMQFEPVYIASNSNATIMTQLGLNGVPYPYPGGSWNEYFSYVKGNGFVANAGYARHYGYLTLVNYWLDREPGHDETPNFWMTSAQPVTAVKDAVEVFLSYMQQGGDDEDRVGLVVYTSSNGTAVLESGLTHDFTLLQDITRHRQAGHYHELTNIGAGMQKARIELEQHGRPGTLKMIVLLTDGLANLPQSTSGGQQFVMQEAQQAKDADIPIVTVSLGAAADMDLMAEVAQITGGVHFNVPGGQSVASYEEDLMEVFTEIASERPLRLVH